MKIFLFSVLVLLTAFSLNAQEARINENAPGFSLTDSKGVEHKLSDYSGKYVVLEWINFDCPFVKKHYSSGNMQKLQKEWTAKGVIWLSVCSSAEGKQGNFFNDEINKRIKSLRASQTAYLIDASGETGKKYGAKTTPHMYVINPEGKIIYMGAIDDKPSTDTEDIEGAVNYVSEALNAAIAGKEVAVKTTKAYGCSVKYSK